MTRTGALKLANEARFTQSSARRATALRMHADGHGAGYIAITLGITESMVRRYIRDARRTDAA